MKVAWIKFASIAYLMFVLVACTQFANPNVSNDMTPSPSDSTSTAFTPALAPGRLAPSGSRPERGASVTPQQGDATPVLPDLQTPSTSGLETLIKMAKEDLARRMSISTNQINLVEATEAEWSDSSLDCPQPGMSYLQIMTPGYRILLEANGAQYEYHSNRDGYIVYCDNANPPVLPKP